MPSANIAFNNLPASIRKPGKYFEFNTSTAVRTLPGNLQKTLIVGQKTVAGTVLANTPIDVFSDVDAATYFGRGSIAHLMARSALQANNYLALTMIALDDAGGSIAAAGTVTLAGNASGGGSLGLNVGDQSVVIAVSAADTPTIIAAALVAQIAKQPDLPVTASAVAGVVTLTAKNKGTLGNAIKFSATTTAAGVSAAVVAMTGGATDPTIATALATVFAAGHNVIITAWNDAVNLTSLRTHLDNVSGPLEQRGAIGIYAHTGTLAQSTTLAAIVDYCNRNRKDPIITVEDPLEFVHESKGCLVNHREVGIHTKSFAAALRGALREDPDIVLVGELRDLETIELALTAASTGHLVFGTLHTQSAAKTVDRIIDVFPADQQNKIRATLSESLKGVVAQNLFKRIDKKGRVAALEILVFSTAISNLVREGKTHQIPGMIQVGKKAGNMPLDDSIMDHLRMKRISPEDAYDKSLDKKKFRPVLATPPEDEE